MTFEKHEGNERKETRGERGLRCVLVSQLDRTCNLSNVREVHEGKTGCRRLHSRTRHSVSNKSRAAAWYVRRTIFCWLTRHCGPRGEIHRFRRPRHAMDEDILPLLQHHYGGFCTNERSAIAACE